MLRERVASRYMVQDTEDPRRTEPPQEGLAEREMLEAWLEFHRTTLLLKAEGMDDRGRKARPVASVPILRFADNIEPSCRRSRRRSCATRRGGGPRSRGRPPGTKARS